MDKSSMPAHAGLEWLWSGLQAWRKHPQAMVAVAIACAVVVVMPWIGGLLSALLVPFQVSVPMLVELVTVAPAAGPALSLSLVSPVPLYVAGGVTTTTSVAPLIVTVIVWVVPSTDCTVKLSTSEPPVASASTVALALLSV